MSTQRKITHLLFSTALFLLLIGCSSNKENSKNQDSLSQLIDTIPPVENISPSKDSTKPSSVRGSALSSEYSYKGDFQEAWKWYDANGKNVLILSKSEQLEQSSNEYDEFEGRTAELFAKHYLMRSSTPKPEILWELYDLEKLCEFDLTAAFVFSPVFTDLDQDNVKESFIAYKLACRSDLSPARMKIIVHENKDKYALRGDMFIRMNPEVEDTFAIEKWEPDLSKVSLDKEDYVGTWGRYENAKDFSGAPAAFLEKAKELWVENFREN
jgi:uncharacterized protein YcfL